MTREMHMGNTASKSAEIRTPAQPQSDTFV